MANCKLSAVSALQNTTCLPIFISITVLGFLATIPSPRTNSSNLRSWCLCLSYGYIRLYFKTIIREKHGGTCLCTQISEAEPRGWIFVSLRSAWSTQEISEQPDLLRRENLIWCWVVVLCIIHIYINTLHIKASDTSLSNYRISFLGFTSYINSWSLERGTKIWRLFLTIGVYNPQVKFPFTWSIKFFIAVCYNS